MMRAMSLGAAISVAATMFAAAAEARPVPRDRPAAAIPAERPQGSSLAELASAPMPRQRPLPIATAATAGIPAGELAAGHERQAVCLAQAIYFEARGEPLAGQFAVARVILNRTADRRFPNTICEVVYQDAERKDRCQFSFACDGLPDEPEDQMAWALARGMAEALMRVEQPRLSRSVLRATHYHANYVAPWWAAKLGMAGRVGRHVFYARTRQGETRHASAAEPAAR
jgi:spore germination cell wall hydrolase CwlJ-like protein